MCPVYKKHAAKSAKELESDNWGFPPADRNEISGKCFPHTPLGPRMGIRSHAIKGRQFFLVVVHHCLTSHPATLRSSVLCSSVDFGRCRLQHYLYFDLYTAYFSKVVLVTINFSPPVLAFFSSSQLD